MTDGGATEDAADVALVTYRDVVLADAPVGFWRLGDQGTTARDETGRTDGTYQGSCNPGVIGALAGDANTAVSFDGASCIIDFGDTLAFLGNAAFTLEMWARVAMTAGSQVFFMKETRDATDPIDGYALVASSAGVYFERLVNQNGIGTPPVSLSIGTYIHLVATFDGAVGRLYIDGVLVGTSNPDLTPMPVYSAPSWVGAIPPGFTFFQGDLDELAIYPTALPLDRIQLHHSVGLNGPR